MSRLTALLAVVVVGCTLDLGPSSVSCFEDTHCPAAWHCAIPDGLPTGFCAEGAPGSDPLDVDDDGDGFSDNEGDCDDADSSNFPGNIEACNGRDDDFVQFGVGCGHSSEPTPAALPPVDLPPPIMGDPVAPSPATTPKAEEAPAGDPAP